MKTIGSIAYIILMSLSVILRFIPVLLLAPGDAVKWLAEKVLKATQ